MAAVARRSPAYRLHSPERPKANRLLPAIDSNARALIELTSNGCEKKHGFVREAWVQQLDFGSLEKISGAVYVARSIECCPDIRQRELQIDVSRQKRLQDRDGMSAKPKRLRRTYDYRLGQLYVATGDSNLLKPFGIPRSTLHGWSRRHRIKVVSAKPLELESEALEVQVMTLQLQVRRLGAIVALETGPSKRTVLSSLENNQK